VFLADSRKLRIEVFRGVTLRVPTFERITLLPFSMIKQPQSKSAQRPFVGNYTPSDNAAHPSTPDTCAMQTVHKLFAENRSSSVCVWTSCSVAEHSCVSVQ